MGTEKDVPGTSGKTQDDAGVLNSEYLKFDSVRLPLAMAIGLLPVLATSMLYVSTFSIMTQAMMGVGAGLIGMFAFQLFEVHRGSARRQKTLHVAQLSELTRDDVHRLIEERESFPDWAIFTEFDKVEWLNRQLDIIWPFLDKAITDILKAQLEPILAQYTLGPIQKFTMNNLTLGVKGPRFDGIRVTEGEEDETVLETQFQWTPEKDNIVLKIESTGPDYKVKLKDIFVKGTLKFILKPLLEKVPCFGAVLVSFTEVPEFEFNLKFLGGMSIDAVPGVESFIDGSIRTALNDQMVWPCRIVVPVAEGDWSYLELHPIAELDVTLLEATDIMKTDIIGKSDPFFEFYVREKADKMQRSTTKKNKKQASWQEGFKLEVEDRDTQSLTIRLMDDESVQKSQYIGSAELKISDMAPNKVLDVWVDMLEKPATEKGGTRGRAHLNIIYKPLPDSDPRKANYKRDTAGAPTASKKDEHKDLPTSNAPSKKDL